MTVLADYDVAIAGGGPAGAATARRLAQAGCRVVLLERSHFEGPRAGESLAPAVQPLLHELGVQSQFEALHPLPSFGTRSVWGTAESEDYSHVMTPYGNGYHVDRPAFDRMLAHSAVDAGAELQTGARVCRCRWTDDETWALAVESSAGVAELRARIVIDASGRNSPLSRRFGAERVVFDRLVGIACGFAASDTAAECYTLVETCRDGWWYSAPAAPVRLIAMLMTDGDLAAASRAKSPEAWMQDLVQSKATAARLRSGQILWGPRTFPAVSQRLVRSEMHSPWFAVGDAALSVDPISGSGVIRALRTARAAADTALAVLRGDRAAIAGYELSRHEDCTEYLHERSAYYGLEQRWGDSAFWSRRLRGPGAGGRALQS